MSQVAFRAVLAGALVREVPADFAVVRLVGPEADQARVEGRHCQEEWSARVWVDGWAADLDPAAIFVWEACGVSVCPAEACWFVVCGDVDIVPVWVCVLWAVC